MNTLAQSEPAVQGTAPAVRDADRRAPVKGGLLLLLAAVLVAAVLFAGGAAASERMSRFSFAAVGDVLIHGRLYKAMAKKDGGYDFHPAFRLVRDRISSHDLAFCNQESILGGTEIGLSTYPRFNSPQEVGDAVVRAGFNLVSLANNHTLDRGEKAILRSLKYWSAQEGVWTAGSFLTAEGRRKPAIVEVNGLRCAFLAYTTLTNGLRAPEGKEHYVNVYRSAQAKEDVQAAAALADVVIVSMHWGSEYTFTPSSQQRTIAKELAAWGAHIVVGHHPHVVQPVVMEGDTLVIYSLGNFISAQNGVERNVGLLVSLDVVRREREGQSALSFENITGTLLYNPSRSSFGRYVVVPFDQMTELILPKYHDVFARYAARVKVDGTIAMRAPSGVRKPAPKSGGGRQVRK